MSDKTLKRVILALNIILFGGLLVFSVIFFVVNIIWNPMKPQNAGFNFYRHFFWRSTAEIIMLICGRIHLIGHGVVLLIALVRKKILSAVKLTVYYIAQIFLMLLCIAPFFCMDTDFRWDYSYIVLLTASRLLPLWGAAAAIGLGQKLYLKVTAKR